MRARFPRWLAVAMLVAHLAVGCRKDGYSKYQGQELKFLHLYASRDLPTVEAALLKHRETSLQMQVEGVQGVDYDSILALVNARLCYFYARTGRSNEADRFFLEATNHMNVRKRLEGLHYTPVSRDDVYRIVEYADSKVKPRWKSNN